MSTLAIVYLVMIFVTFVVFFRARSSVPRWSVTNFIVSGFWAMIWPFAWVVVLVLVLGKLTGKLTFH